MANPRKKYKIKFSENCYTEFPAPGDLLGIADNFWSFKITPLKTKTVEFNFVPTHQSLLAIIKKDNRITDIFFHGPSFKEKKFRSDKPVIAFCANLTPFAAIRLFELDYSRLIYGSIRLKEVINRNEYSYFKKSIENCDNEADFINAMTVFLKSRLRMNVTVDSVVEKLCQMIVITRGEKRFGEYYSHFRVNKRNIQRKFRNTFGFSPKEFARLVRIQHACSELVASGFKHFDVIYRYGYYDQSHYIKEFKKIMGSSPKDFESSQRKIVYKLIEK